jgi:hypothetical protein
MDFFTRLPVASFVTTLTLPVNFSDSQSCADREIEHETIPRPRIQ